jgi:hypothetical protein
MSLATHQYDRQYYKQNSQPNSRRRYTLEPPIHSTTSRNYNNHREQNVNTNISRPTNSLNANKYGIKSSINDPWVKELLERDIDFTKLDQQQAPVEFLDVRHYKNKSIPQDFYHNEDNFKTRIARPSKTPLIADENRSTLSSQSKRNN